MAEWIPTPPVSSRSEPYLVARADLDELRRYLAEHDAGVGELDVADATSISDIIDRMFGVLPFPGWTGHGWDSIFDVTEELRAELTFPFAVVFRGFDRLLAARQHAALQLAIRMTDLGHELALRKSQRIAYYEGESWT